MKSITQHAVEIKAQFGAVLNGRIEAGQQLALTGKVSQVDANSWQVTSQSEPGQLYRVSWAGAWGCTCKDFDGSGYHPAPTLAAFGGCQAVCKHIVACVLIWSSGEQPAPVVADLVIATRKRPFTSGSEDYQILWYKRTGADKVEPTGKTLLDSDIQKALGKYSLVATEARAGQVIRRYRVAA